MPAGTPTSFPRTFGPPLLRSQPPCPRLHRHPSRRRNLLHNRRHGLHLRQNRHLRLPRSLRQIPLRNQHHNLPQRRSHHLRLPRSLRQSPLRSQHLSPRHNPHPNRLPPPRRVLLRPAMTTPP